MDTKLVTIALISLIVGAGAGYLFSGAKTVPNQHIMPDGSSMHGEMNSMMSGLSGKTGDAFDKAFLSEMIVHHEGAVEMAQAALVSAKHDEIKQMASTIIRTQTTEIEQMKEWLATWYGQ